MQRFQPVKKLLLGPGPSEVYPSILEQMSQPLLGHLDPDFLKLMDELRTMLQSVFETRNELTMAMPGTGSAGMETVLVNLIEPGDKVIIGVNGVFGSRMVDVAERAGAQVVSVLQDWGQAIQPEQIEQAIREHVDAVLVAVVHAETSTGVRQPLEEIAGLVHQAGMLLVVDAVTSLGGIQVGIDAIGIDACYSGTQKCLSTPPGLSPVTFGPKAIEKLERRKTKVQSWYLDTSMIRSYWSQERFYHHTAPITMNYALHEGLRLLLEEGLEASFRRHQQNGRALQAGLEAMGLQLVVEESVRLPMLTTMYIPEGIQDAHVRQELLQKHLIEIGGGLGPFKGKAWRIGLMGHGSNRDNVLQVLDALAKVLNGAGHRADGLAGVDAASKVYSS
jgi:alanine-glyoxylate transaminase / serine-glyoxylate transaminase / serine-pyruvate transaminase